MKYIAMFLPQFHECEFNSEWWGKGFTEWNNVKKTNPLFKGHRQPRIPSDGYFDLGSANEISRQARQAADYGIDAFSIYHYWYEGKRPLKKPLDIILDDPNIEIEFSLCWANHSWTRSWKNRAGALDVLIEQTYEVTPKARNLHFAFLAKAFSDSRYTQIEGKPLFQIYMPEFIPNSKLFIDELRNYCISELGTDLYISAMIKNWSSDWTYLDSFDSLTFFNPTLALFSPVNIFGENRRIEKNYFTARLRNSPVWLKSVLYTIQDLLPDRPTLYSYEETWNLLLDQYEKARSLSRLPVFPMAFVDFDNTPRYKKRAKIFKDFDVDVFQQKLTQLADLAGNSSPSNIVFINAWNEWGEGMYIQPESNENYTRLNAVRNSKSRSSILF